MAKRPANSARRKFYNEMSRRSFVKATRRRGRIIAVEFANEMSGFFGDLSIKEAEKLHEVLGLVLGK